MIPILLLIVAISASTSAAQEACGSQSEVLFRSNAYLDSSLVPSSGVGGTVLQTQEEWSVFHDEFIPNNYGEALERASIDFTAEKVVVGTYYTTSTCQVTISHAQLYCATSNEGTVQMTMKMDVVDASLDCNLQCAALGQVVFAIAVPTEWNIDEDTGYEINVTGPCVSRSSESPVEILLDTTTTTTEATTFDSSSKSGEFDRDDIDYTKTSSTEPAPYEKSQLQSTVSTQDIIIEDVVIPDSEIPVIEMDTTTTTTLATISETTTVATEPVISIDGTPTASPTVKAEDSSSSSFQPQLWKLAFLLLSSACFLEIIECTIG